MVSQSPTTASLTRIRALITKEIIHILNDRSTYLVTLFFPLMLMILFGLGINLDPGQMDLGLQYPANDRSHYAQFSPLIYSRSFAQVSLDNPQELNRKIQNNKIRAFLYLDDDAQNGIIDGSDTNTAQIFSGTLQGIMEENQQQQLLAQGITRQPPIQIIERSWYNPDRKTQWTLVPGSMAIIMTLIATLLSSLVIAKEYEKGMIESLYVTPLSIGELYLAKWLPYFLLSLGVLIGTIGFAVGIYHIPIRGSFIFFGLSSLCFLYSAVNMGLCLSITFKDQFLCSQLALMSAYMPSFMLSGFLFELTSMPEPIQFLSYFVGARYFVPALQIFFLGGGSIIMVAKNCLYLVILGTFWLILSWRKLHKRIVLL